MAEINLDLEEQEVSIPVEKKEVEKKSTKKVKHVEPTNNDEGLVSCLRNERVIIRHIAKTGGIWGTNPKHVLSGGMADGAVKIFCVPRLPSGVYKNVLTNSEKEFLEDYLGLEYNALSVYKKGKDNFWNEENEDGINRVRLVKEDNFLDLSDANDYIRYKILLANSQFIAPSLQALEDAPKASYQFVIISDGEETKKSNMAMSTIMMCYKEFGKIEDDFDILKTVVELITGKSLTKDTKIDFLRAECNTIIQNDSKRFLKTVTDPLLSTKVLIKKAIEATIISNRGGMLYLRKDNTPLCGANEEPTLNTAARFLNLPKYQELKFAIEAQLK